MAFITSDKYPGWKGDLLVGSLAFRYLARVKLDGHKVLGETKMLTDVGRVRNVKLGPDGLIYVAVEGPGRILQLQPQGR
jgi:glucose/arabinose dehydrogenase